jgi:uncharacterized protein (TIGR03790 family)
MASFLAPAAARALTPDDIVVIYNAKSDSSLKVAEHYLRARAIPASHLVPITCDAQESVAENIYRLTIVPQIRRVLKERGLDTGVKCLVTTFDVPLTIGPVAAGPANQQVAARLQKQLNTVLADIAKSQNAYDEIARDAGAAAASQPAAGALGEMVARLNVAVQRAVARIQALPAAQRAAELQKLANIHERVAGLTGVLSLFHVRADAADSDAGRREMARLTDQLRDYERQYQDLKARDVPAAKSGMIDLRTRTHGLIGAAQELEIQIGMLAPAESEACFDSELALLLASDQNYARGRWVLNPHNVELWPSIKRMTDVPRTLMVARLDGPTPAAAMDLVNRALKIEKTGLDGKIYLDARGLTGADAYSAFDAELRTAYAWLKENASMETVLDDKAELLEAKDCPDAALYCGWYSLHNYHESVQWVQGAVGYHVASLEMPTLHNPDDTGWVTQMLKRGVAGTLGATAEPYLSSFPKPSLFFPLLLTGEFTQGEVWEVTNPWVSWRVGFAGDPLYNPFKAKPRVKIEAVKSHVVLRNAWEILR